MGEFWQDNAIYGLASFLAGVFNYLYHVVLAHVLGPAQYGELATLLNVTWLWLLPAPVVTLVYTRVGRPPKAQRRWHAVALWGGGLMLWGLVWAVGEPLFHLFRIPAGLFLLFTLEVIPSLALAANQGILQRARSFVWVGVIIVLNNGFRVLAAAGAAWVGLRLPGLGALEGVAAGAAWLLSAWAVRELDHPGESSRTTTVLGTAVVGTITALWSLGDGLLAKHALTPHAAGLYNGLATLGHAVQFVAGSLGVVMMTNILAHPEARRRLFLTTLALYAAVAACFQAAWGYAGASLVRLILGGRFLAIVPVLLYYGWGMVALGLLNLLLLYAVAVKRWEGLVPAGLGMGCWVWGLWHAPRLGDFVFWTTAVSVGTLLATVAVMAIWPWARQLGRRAVVPQP